MRKIQNQAPCNVGDDIVPVTLIGGSTDLTLAVDLSGNVIIDSAFTGIPPSLVCRDFDNDTQNSGSAVYLAIMQSALPDHIQVYDGTTAGSVDFAVFYHRDYAADSTCAFSFFENDIQLRKSGSDAAGNASGSDIVCN